jgi:hypothetical protein
LTGLEPRTDYNVSIRIVCGAGDTSIALTGSFRTYALPATVPYVCGFDSASAEGWTLVNRIQTNCWYIGSAAYNDSTDYRGLYISSDSGQSNTFSLTSNSMVMAVRNISLQAGYYNFSYDWRSMLFNSASFGVALFPEDALLNDANDYALTWFSNNTPENAVALDDYVEYIMNQDGTWHTRSGQIIVPSSGDWNLVIMWRNTNHSDYSLPVAIDNIYLDINSCPIVSDLTYSNVTHNAVTLDWVENGTATSWDVEYGPHGFTPGNGTFHTYFSHPCTLSFLQPSTTYDIYVKPVCSDNQFVFYTGPVTISTEVCAQPDIVEFADNNYSDIQGYVPVVVYAPYSASVMLLDSAQLGGPKDYEGLRFYYTGDNPLTAKDDIDIYLQPTQLSQLSYNSNPLFDSTSARLVYSGPFNFNYGWNTVAFDSVYSYLGNGNIMMFVVDNSGNSQSDAGFRGYTDISGKSIVFYNYTQALSLSELTCASGFQNYTSPFLQLYSCTPYCAPVAGLAVDTVGYNFATLSWSGNAPAYEVTLSMLDSDEQDVVMTVNTNNVTLSGLVPTSHYRCAIRSVCDSVEGRFSQPVTVNIFTDTLLCEAPEGLTVSDIGYSSAVFDWQAATDEGQWMLHIWNTAYDTNILVNEHPVLVECLVQGVSYNAAVRAYCGGGILESDNSNNVQFATLECPPVDNLQASNITQTSVYVSWQSNSAACDIEYGPQGFGAGQGIKINNVSGGHANIGGLTPDVYYDVNVRAKCDAGISSRWTTVTFKTATSGIVANGNTMRAIVSPNPASRNTTVTVNGISGHIDVSVYDLGGRKVLSQSLECGGDCQTGFDVGGLPQGSYFVKIKSNDTCIVQKLIIR